MEHTLKVQLNHIFFSADQQCFFFVWYKNDQISSCQMNMLHPPHNKRNKALGETLQFNRKRLHLYAIPYIFGEH